MAHFSTKINTNPERKEDAGPGRWLLAIDTSTDQAGHRPVRRNSAGRVESGPVAASKRRPSCRRSNRYWKGWGSH